MYPKIASASVSTNKIINTQRDLDYKVHCCLIGEKNTGLKCILWYSRCFTSKCTSKCQPKWFTIVKVQKLTQSCMWWKWAKAVEKEVTHYHFCSIHKSQWRAKKEIDSSALGLSTRPISCSDRRRKPLSFRILSSSYLNREQTPLIAYLQRWPSLPWILLVACWIKMTNGCDLFHFSAHLNFLVSTD